MGSCGRLPAPVDCSYSTSPSERPTVPSTSAAGDYYVLLFTNFANVQQDVSIERTGGLGGTSYYVVRYQLGGRPAIAKLSVAQQRLYCIKIRAAKAEERPGFFEREGALRQDMEAIAASFSVVAVNGPCLAKSNKGSVPGVDVCKVLRP